MDMETFFAFTATSLLLIITPGPNMLYIIGKSIEGGRKKGIFSAMGIHTGYIIHIIFACTGLSAFLFSSQLSYSSLKFLGSLYFIYIGCQMFRNKRCLIKGRVPVSNSLRQSYARGIFINLFNPASALFFITFFPGFVEPDKGAIWIQLLYLGLAYMLLRVFVDLCLVVVSQSFGNFAQNLNDEKFNKWINGGAYLCLSFLCMIN